MGKIRGAFTCAKKWQGGYQMGKRGVPNGEKGGTKWGKLKNVKVILAPVSQSVRVPLKRGEKCSIVIIDFIVYILREKNKGLKPHFFPLWGIDFYLKGKGSPVSESPLFSLSLQRESSLTI